MSLIDKIEKTNKRWILAIFAVLLIYTALHFGYSGVYFPITHPGLGQISEEISPLVKFLQGDEFTFENPRQYGPFFIFAMLPFMILYNNQTIFYLSLLAVQYVLAGAAFFICHKYIFSDKPAKRTSFWILLVIWLNFSPMLYIFAVKNVEVWELFLICIGFAAFIKRRYLWTGFAFAAGALTKFLPGFFITYLFFKNKKAFIWSIISLGSIILLAHMVFGPSIGLLYPLFIIKNSLHSRTWAVLFHENTSLKGFIYKLFGGFQLDGLSHYFKISPKAETAAFIIIITFQLMAILYIAWIALRKKCSKEEVMIQFSIVSVLMLIISPITALEYNVLLLLAYSVGMYFLLYKSFSKYMYLLYGGSYLLIGNFIPFSVLIKLFPIQIINNFFGTARLVPAESYKAYCFPLLGMMFLGIFFILIWHNKRNFEYNDSETDMIGKE